MTSVSWNVPGTVLGRRRPRPHRLHAGFAPRDRVSLRSMHRPPASSFRIARTLCFGLALGLALGGCRTAPPAPFAATSRWIGPSADTTAAPWLRRTFTLPSAPAQATARVASLGFHELWVNGQKVGENVLAPSVSDLGVRARWLDYDLLPHLRAGDNAIVLWLDKGWAAYELFAVPAAPVVRAEFAITTAGGTQQVATDGHWRWHDSPYRHVGRWQFWDFGGERVDAAQEPPGAPHFASPARDDADWLPVRTHEVDLALSPDVLGGNRRIVELHPVAIEQRGPDQWRIDFGRNFTGWFEALLIGPPGGTVTIQVAEREDQLMTYNQRSELVLGPAGTATFANRFNHASGRWYTLTGCGRPQLVRGWLVRSPFASTLEFACSDELLMQVQATAAWTFECLSLGGMVVDCPHRERRGYGGDAHATTRTGLCHFDLVPFYTRWLEDWRDVQLPSGDMPFTAPTRDGGGGPAWSGICIQLPWEVYRWTGDDGVLRANWPMMQRWLAFLRGHVRDGLLQRFGHEDWGFLGDWVPPGRGQGKEQRVDERTTWFFNNAYWLWSVRLGARIAHVLGDDAAAAALAAEAAAIAARVHAEFVVGETSYANGEQPYLALALLAELPPPALRPAVLQRLADLVARQGYLDAGIHGHRFVLDVLTESNRSDLIAELVRRPDHPGYRDMLAQGATTFWEQWDGAHSRLHSSFLGIGAWFVEGLAGIRVDPEHPGFARIRLRPGIESGVTAVRARLATPRGHVLSSWRHREGHLRWHVTVPDGTVADVRVPAPAGATMSVSDAATGQPATLHRRGAIDDDVTFELAAGDWIVECRGDAARP
jgi:hypothetical protein